MEDGEQGLCLPCTNTEVFGANVLDQRLADRIKLRKRRTRLRPLILYSHELLKLLFLQGQCERRNF
ncbi:MAG: hypothetical protein DMF68_00610 [Acidobacteria bacterium]|nr:MAG: hypothetical protein DMF68_00610 [Acidobacteriota bacterium]